MIEAERSPDYGGCGSGGCQKTNYPEERRALASSVWPGKNRQSYCGQRSFEAVGESPAGAVIPEPVRAQAKQGQFASGPRVESVVGVAAQQSLKRSWQASQ